MNQMLKKASSVFTAVVCAASITFSGASLVMADSEIDEQTLSMITATAEGLTQTIIPLTDDDIAAYQASGDEFTESAMTAWVSVKEELGDLRSSGSAEVEYSDNEYVATVPVEFENEDANFVYIFDEGAVPTSLTVDIQYSFATTMKNAALNTLMGLGTVFAILVLLIVLISLFKYIPGSGAQQVKVKKEETPAPAAVAAPVQQEADNSELIAVIAAAIAASEGTSTDGFVVRSIRKINRKKR